MGICSVHLEVCEALWRVVLQFYHIIVILNHVMVMWYYIIVRVSPEELLARCQQVS